MKILHIIPTLGSGGAEKMLVDLVKEMRHQKVECEVAVLSKGDNFFGGGLETLKVPVYYGPLEKVYAIKNIFFLQQLVKKHEYDVIHTHLFSPQLFMPIALKFVKKKYRLITTEHSTHNKRRDRRIFKPLDKWLYKQHYQIIAITADTKKNLVNYLPELSTKVTVIENGIDIQHYAEANSIERKELLPTMTQDEKLVLMVAGMREQKDHETLIRASKLLPADYRVVFVGAGERFDEVKAYAKQYGRQTILFLGSRKDVPSIMKASDVFVLSSKWEGFGLVVVEAAAAGLPVITSDVEGMNDVVRNIGGQVFEPYNEVQLAEKIVNAVSAGDTNNNLANYTIQKTVQKYVENYSNLLKG